jgi:hypothetical protein
MRETRIKGHCVLDAPHLLGGQGNVQRCDVVFELLDFPTSDDGENVGELMQVVRNNDYKREGKRSSNPRPMSTETLAKKKIIGTYVP